MRLVALAVRPMVLLVVPAALLAGCASVTPAGGSDEVDLGHVDAAARDQARPVDLAIVPDLARAPDLAPPIDLLSSDLVLAGSLPGETCLDDTDCMSRRCIDLFGGNRFCGAPCKSQQDCAGFLNLFCDPRSAGSLDGYCVPRSPAHCASCSQDSDCGSLSERCLQAQGDIAPACHVDCSLAGAAACPNDYACAPIVDGNQLRSLCVPNGNVCLDAFGGFCDRVVLPQPCARTNQAGVCVGQRTCLGNAKRFDRCGAIAPQFKPTCQTLDPAGCTLAFDPNAARDKLNCGKCGKACAQGQDCCNQACTPITTVQNCGACGKVCPGSTNTSDAVCANMACDMTCRGDNYDVDKSPQNGCEQPDLVPPAHSKPGAFDRGHKPCDDGPSSDDLKANVPSDARVHTNSDGFISGVVGAAPDWWQVHADGGNFCVNDYSVTLTTAGGGNARCYTATIITNKITDSVTVAGNDSATISAGDVFNSKYDGGTTIYFSVAKTCNLPVQEFVTYTLHYHL